MDEISMIDFFKTYQTENIYRIIDVRDLHEYEENHIKGAINIPLSLLLDKYVLFINKNYSYYIICKNGSRSRAATQVLHKKGYKVTNVIGGMDRWPGAVVRTRKTSYGT